MSKGLLFWIIMVVCIVFSGYVNRTTLRVWAYSSLPVFVLIFLLGWKVFGFIVQD